MNQTHLHLLTNHLPILGFLFSVILLLWGILAKSKTTIMATAVVVFLSAAGGMVASNTGEAAEEQLEQINGISHAAIHEHEEAAEAAVPFIIASGILSLAMLFFSLKNHRFGNITQWLLLASVALGSVLSARAGFTGGKIRHAQEIGDTFPAQQEKEHQDEEKD
jgi:hypothetical protein